MVSVKRKPKKMSFGVFVAAIAWLAGDKFWHLGTSLWYLTVICVLSFVVDLAVTGNSSRDGVYID